MTAIARLCTVLSVSLALAGCAGAPAAADPPPPSLDGTAWVLAALPGAPSQPPTGGAAATLRFEAGRASGTDGCNRFVAAYAAQDGSFSFDARGAMTRMACPPPVVQHAEAFMAALAAARAYRVVAGQLQLLASDGSVRASLAPQPAALAGTNWRATAIHNGRGAVSSLVAGTSVSLAFGADGQATGTAGCNRFTARYTAEGEQLRILAPAATRRACAEAGVMEQEQAFLKALETVATQRREADRLELRTATGALAVMLELDRGS